MQHGFKIPTSTSGEIRSKLRHPLEAVTHLEGWIYYTTSDTMTDYRNSGKTIICLEFLRDYCGENMEWNHNPTEQVYEIYEDGEKKAVIPEKVASEVEAIVPGLGRVPIDLVTLGNSEESSEQHKEITRADMPEIPDAPNLQTQTDGDFYERLVEDPTSQPAQYRRAIRANGRISRVQFDDMAEDMGYNPDAGAHNASLLMLQRIGEIDREGRGDNQTIRWTGE